MFGTEVDSSAPTTIFPVSLSSCMPSLSRPSALVSGALPEFNGRKQHKENITLQARRERGMEEEGGSLYGLPEVF